MGADSQLTMASWQGVATAGKDSPLFPSPHALPVPTRSSRPHTLFPSPHALPIPTRSSRPHTLFPSPHALPVPTRSSRPHMLFRLPHFSPMTARQVQIFFHSTTIHSPTPQVRILALTDHDSMAGVPEATAAGREVGMCVIPGVEVSAYYDCHTPKITGGGAVANGSQGDGMEEEDRGVERGKDGGEGIETEGEGRREGEAEGVREGRGGQGVHVLAYFPPLGMRERWQYARRGEKGDRCGGEEGREGEEEGEDGEEREEGGEGEGKKQRVSDDVIGAEEEEEEEARDAQRACPEGAPGSAAEGAAEGAGSVVGSAGGESTAGGKGNEGDGLKKLVGVLEGIREGRHKRAAGMVQRLQQLGVGVTMADVIQQLDDPKTAPGRVHVARALVAVRAVGDMEEAFQKYIGDHGPAYVRGSEIPLSESIRAIRYPIVLLPFFPHPSLPFPSHGGSEIPLGAEIPVAEAIRVINEAGGAAVLAHPWTIPESALRGMLKRVAGAGLVGMEVYRGKEIQEEYCRLANAHGLLKIGGSDFHGAAKLAKKGGVDLGGCELPALAVQRFLEAAGRNWRAC
ncbi:unnamed protein product [Closterium sp. NIES-64]|nr:unnamed protein product [Closterium sp. NIES-64]